MIHNDQVNSWYDKIDKLQQSASESIRKIYLPKHSYLSDGNNVNVDYTEEERKAVYAEIAKSFYTVQKEGDVLLESLQKQEQSPEIMDDIKAISGKIASFLTNTRLYDYSEGQDSASKFEKLRAKYLEIYNRVMYISGKAKLQKMVNKSGVVYNKDEVAKQRGLTQSSFDEMNHFAQIAKMKKQNA